MQKLQKLSQIAKMYIDQLTGAACPQLYYHPQGVFKSLIPHIGSLQKKYRPTPWLSNPHAQMLYFDLIKKRTIHLKYDEIEHLNMPDGGVTAIAWYGKHLSAETPTIVLMHTLTGSPESMREVVQDLHHYTGWRIALCLRRGHANLPMPVPKINLLGCTQDLRAQILYIQQRFTQSDLYAVGSSAGTGLLIRYLGEQGKDTPFKAAFAVSPGYNTELGFQYVHPFYSKLMTKKLLKAFVKPYQTMWETQCNLTNILKVKNLAEFEQCYFEMAGFSDYQSYTKMVNPIHFFQAIKIPLVVLNAEDDPICHIENLMPYKDIFAKMPNVLVVVTPKGSHCVFYEGLIKTRSWSTQLIVQYFQHFALNKVIKKPSEAGSVYN